VNKEEFAAKLNSCSYREEILGLEEAIASANRLVVVFGASDDNMEFRGAIHDEVSCYGGGTAHLNSDGLLKNDCDDDRCPHFEKAKAVASIIEARWCEEEGYSWTFNTTIPHATFEIVEDGAPFCRGIVFDLDHLASVDAQEPELDHSKTAMDVQIALGFTDTGWVDPSIVLHRIAKLKERAEGAGTLDSARYRWLLPIVSGADDPMTDAKALAIASMLISGLEGDEVIDRAMKLVNGEPEKVAA
jgi:hypothetical protein